MVSSTAAAKGRKRAIAWSCREVPELFTDRARQGQMPAQRATSQTRPMLSNQHTVRIAWGDCDPAGIVFYPRYFAMFDHATVLLIERALGMSKQRLYSTFAFDGYPVLESQARFLLPTRFCDDVVIDSTFTEVGRSSFRIAHRLSKEGTRALEASERRVWVVRDPARPGRFKAQPLPAEAIAKFTAAD